MEDDESTNETTEMMPFSRTETFFGKFRKPCNKDHQDEEDPSFDCWDGKHEQFDAFQHMDLWARNASKIVRCERVLLK